MYGANTHRPTRTATVGPSLVGAKRKFFDSDSDGSDSDEEVQDLDAAGSSYSQTTSLTRSSDLRGCPLENDPEVHEGYNPGLPPPAAFPFLPHIRSRAARLPLTPPRRRRPRHLNRPMFALLIPPLCPAAPALLLPTASRAASSGDNRRGGVALRRGLPNVRGPSGESPPRLQVHPPLPPRPEAWLEDVPSLLSPAFGLSGSRRRGRARVRAPSRRPARAQ